MSSRATLLVASSGFLGVLGWRWVRQSQTETRHLGGQLARYRHDQDVVWISALLRLLAGGFLMAMALWLLRKALSSSV